MNAKSPNQMELLGEPDASASSIRDSNVIAVGLDQYAFLKFLVDDWILPDPGGWISAGRGCIENISDPELQVVVVWFDISKLPPAEVMVWRGASWAPRALSRLSAADKIMRWPGPLPLFAATQFSVESEQFRAHLIAMVRGFSDIEMPLQPFDVRVVERMDAYPGCEVLAPAIFPETWDKLRGAASMAFATVPTIGPWLQILCESLTNGRRSIATEVAQAPWLSAPLWKSPFPSTGLHLWDAMVREFSRPDLFKNWRARQILHDICAGARLLGEDDILLDRLVDATDLLLQDRGTIEDLGVQDNLVALVLQLVLLRPEPDRFENWKEDWRAIPPGAWWSGALLSGFLCGYSRLPSRLRGERNVRRHLALRTWALASPNGIDIWGKWCKDKVTWKSVDEHAQINIGKETLSSRKMSQRGLWYEQDLMDPEIRADATALARDVCPHLIQQTLKLKTGIFKYVGPGRIKVAAKQSTLSVEGDIEISLGQGAGISSKLDESGFRSWLTIASIPYRLPRPVPQHAALQQATQIGSQSSLPTFEPDSGGLSRASSPKNSTLPLDPPAGLIIIPNFIDELEEFALLDTIDSSLWNDSMARRVQHYGWRYDYKSRRIDPNSYLGPLPGWAQTIATRLFEDGLVPELPDQVIVNEYVVMQGISKHIDCAECFKGPIVTLSLNETWEMVFSRRHRGDEQKYKVLLPNRSVAVLDGESRSKWSHEIAKKRTDEGIPRGRRVSITFRKVSI